MSNKQLEKILYTPEDRLKQKLDEKKWVKNQLFISQCGKIPRNASKENIMKDVKNQISKKLTDQQ